MQGKGISIHVPREGHDQHYRSDSRERRRFLSTCPVRGTTRKFCREYFIGMISIHVPREGHDSQALDTIDGITDISIHVPREGHDQSWWSATTYR